MDGLDISSSNYQIAVDKLQRRYGSKEVLLDAHYEAPHKLPKATSSTEFRRTFDTIEMHLRVLESLGEDMTQSQLRVVLYPSSRTKLCMS